MSFSWTRIRAILVKELRDYRHNRFVLGTMVFLPLLFIAAPTIAAAQHAGRRDQLQAGYPDRHIAAVPAVDSCDRPVHPVGLFGDRRA